MASPEVGYSDIPKGFKLADDAVYSDIPKGFAIEESIPKNFKERVADDFERRQLQSNALSDRALGMKQSTPENLAQMAGIGLGLMGDIAGNAAGSAYRYLPDVGTTDLVKDGLRGIGQGINAVAPNAKQGLSYLMNEGTRLSVENPRAAANLGAAANIASVAPVGAGVKSAVRIAANPELQQAALTGAKNTLTLSKDAVMSPLALKKAAFPEKAPILGSEELSQNARGLYKGAADYGGVLKPEVTNKFISEIEALTPQTEMGKVLAGDNVFTQTVEKVKSFRDRPIDLSSAQEIDEILGDLVDGQFAQGRLSKEGKKILDVQNAFRKSIDDATEIEVVGGKQGFDALKQARGEWAKAAKTRDIERIITRAEQTDNPATSIKTGFRTLANNPNRMRGYSPEVQKAIRNAANSGFIGDTLRTVLGSRLVGGLMGNAAGGFGGAIASQAVSAASRGAAAKMQLSKAEKVLRLIQQGKKPTMKEIAKMPPREGMETLGLLKQTEGMTPEQLQEFIKMNIKE